MRTWTTVVAQPDELGESPFWQPEEQRLYWVDIPSRMVRRLDPQGGDVESWAMPMEPGCIAPVRSGGLMIALRDGVYGARTWAGSLTQLAAFAHDVKTTRFNDGKADPLGRFWAGTMYEPRDARRAELFSIDLRQPGEPLVQRMAGDATIANGLAWSPDGGTVYWSDTTAHVIRAWDWEAATNRMSHPRVFHQFAAKPAGWQPGQPGYGGRPDGAAVDVDGNYWCAMFEGGQLLKLSPQGQVIDQVPVPVQCPTMPCFGGADLKTLYVTSARHKRPADELRQQPQSGCVIATRVDVAGLAVNFVSA
jgi:sugar lactone lactonase YvrE